MKLRLNARDRLRHLQDTNVRNAVVPMIGSGFSGDGINGNRAVRHERTVGEKVRINLPLRLQLTTISMLTTAQPPKFREYHNLYRR